MENIPGDPLSGLDFQSWSSGRIHSGMPDGLVERWNETQPCRGVTAGCEVLNVNGREAPDCKDYLKDGCVSQMRVQVVASDKEQSPCLSSLSTCASWEDEKPTLMLPLARNAEDLEEVQDSLSLLHAAKLTVSCISVVVCSLQAQPRLRWNSPCRAAFVARMTRAMHMRGAASPGFGSIGVDDSLQIPSDLYELLLEGAQRAKSRGAHRLMDGRLLLSNRVMEARTQTSVHF